jgi:uncharacterized protein
MKWQGRPRSTNIEDRRGTPGGTGGNFGRMGGGLNPFGRSGGGIPIPIGRSGGGIGGIIAIVVILGLIWMFTGTNPLDMLTGGQTSSPSTTSSQSRPLPQAGQDDLADFVGVVIKETETLWTEVFEQNNIPYEVPTVVLFTGGTESGCGAASSEMGPFYCPVDQKVYIDLSFYDQLRQQFGAPGDFAQAYVLAHEVGHHVQNVLGVLPEFNRLRQSMSQEESNAYSVRVELQADCYAGVWANFANQENLLEQGDINEAINAAEQIGDDTLQRRMQGFAVPKTFNHGTSAQRAKWFQRGAQSGDVGQCDTFAVANP